jgi:hypothetical protein
VAEKTRNQLIPSALLPRKNRPAAGSFAKNKKSGEFSC